jgi:hypothetical protein
MTEPPIDDDTAQPRESIADLCGELVDDAKLLARAEIARVRAIVFRRIVKGRMAILFALASALLAQSAVLLLLVGLLLYLRRHIGILPATGVVMAGAVAASALFAWLAFRQVKAALNKEDDLL